MAEADNTPHHASDEEMESYLRRFDDLGIAMGDYARLRTQIDSATCGDERIEKIVVCLDKQDKINQDLHAMLIEMNNILGK